MTDDVGTRPDTATTARTGTLTTVMSPRGFAVVLLGVAGALAGHWIGTTLAAPAEMVDHSYLGTTGAVLTPLFIASLSWLALKGARTVGVGHLAVGHLLAIQVTVFTGQELVELASAGLPLGEIFTQPAIVVGLAAQLPVALLIVMTVRLAGTIASAFIGRTPPHPEATAPLLGPARNPRPQLVPVRVHGPRGPPRLR